MTVQELLINMSRTAMIRSFHRTLDTAPPYDVTKIFVIDKGRRPMRKTDPRAPGVIITSNDCVADSATSGENAMLVSSASSRHPGGGVRNGAKAQEEHICRNSNAYFGLKHIDKTIGYPLHSKKIGALVFPGVRLCGNFSGVVDLVSVFSAPCRTVRDPLSFHRGVFESLWVAVQQQEPETVVVPPVGCGVFGHDPRAVARALKEIVEEYETPERTARIIISCFGNSENRSAFEEVFSSSARSC